MDRNRIAALESEALSHRDALYGYALRMTRNRQDAEDLVQEAYIKALRNLDRHRDGRFSRAWFFQILTNTYIDDYRHRQRRPATVSLNEELSAGTAPVEEPELLDSIADEVRVALDELPPSIRPTLLLKDIEGFRYREIAEMLGVPIGTVMSRLHRGRRLLRESLKTYATENGYVARAA